jgi:hypothetical protein
MAGPCRFFASGSCKFGDQCRYEHVLPGGGGGDGVASDPFAAPSTGKRGIQGSGGVNDRNRRKSGGAVRDTPTWPLTCVASHPVSSGNTVTGDMSQEELRALAYTSAPRGMSQEVIQREEAIVAEFQQRNNGAPVTTSHTPGATLGPFGDTSAPQHQQSIFGSPAQPGQPPIFGATPAISAQQQPIFPTTTHPADSFGFQQQHQPAATVPVIPPEQQFAFQQVPETAPPF